MGSVNIGRSPTSFTSTSKAAIEIAKEWSNEQSCPLLVNTNVSALGGKKEQRIEESKRVIKKGKTKRKLNVNEDHRGSEGQAYAKGTRQ